jgi:hypothetical protein
LSDLKKEKREGVGKKIRKRKTGKGKKEENLE